VLYVAQPGPAQPMWAELGPAQKNENRKNRKTEK